MGSSILQLRRKAPEVRQKETITSPNPSRGSTIDLSGARLAETTTIARYLDCWAARQQLNRRCPSGSLGVVGLCGSGGASPLKESSPLRLLPSHLWRDESGLRREHNEREGQLKGFVTIMLTLKGLL